jgi:hypothetical protein
MLDPFSFSDGVESESASISSKSSPGGISPIIFVNSSGVNEIGSSSASNLHRGSLSEIGFVSSSTMSVKVGNSSSLPKIFPNSSSESVIFSSSRTSCHLQSKTLNLPISLDSIFGSDKIIQDLRMKHLHPLTRILQNRLIHLDRAGRLYPSMTRLMVVSVRVESSKLSLSNNKSKSLSESLFTV